MVSIKHTFPHFNVKRENPIDRFLAGRKPLPTNYRPTNVQLLFGIESIQEWI